MPSTPDAFAEFRRIYPAKTLDAERVRNDDEVRPMMDGDGLKQWANRSEQNVVSGPDRPVPLVIEQQCLDLHLWVVTPDDVRHAPERCQVGLGLESGELKHSNLTGGLPAHCGGQLLFQEDDEIILTGLSGRYGPNSEEELRAVARAFRCSGYLVWSMGWDDDANRPASFIGFKPALVE